MYYITFFRFEVVKCTLKLLQKPKITHQTLHLFQALPFMWENLLLRHNAYSFVCSRHNSNRGNCVSQVLVELVIIMVKLIVEV